MVGLAAFGTMNAMLSAGARISGERAVGWNRQLRITPLTTRNYFRAKVITGYVMSSLTLAALYIAGTILGVSLTGGEWVRMTGLILIGLLPFAGLGIVFGHLLTPDSIGPAMGGSTALLVDPRRRVLPDHERNDAEDRRGPAVVLARPGRPRRARRARAGRRPGGSSSRPGRSVLRALARWAYRRDTRRV